MSRKRHIHILIFLILGFFHFNCYADYDSVIVGGSSAIYGMKVRNVHVSEGLIKVETTGAIFQINTDQSVLNLVQKIGIHRNVGSFKFITGIDNLRIVEKNLERVIVDTENFNLGIYGDSSFIISPKKNGIIVRYKSHFSPDYIGNKYGEYMLADDFGGMIIYPQRYESGYKIIKKKLDEDDFNLSYKINYGQRILSGVFPPRDYNLIQSFNDKIVFCNGYSKNGVSTGILVDNETIEKWSKYVNIICLFNGGLYKGLTNGKGYTFPGREPYKWPFVGPYKPFKPSELKRVVNVANSLNMKVIVYISFLFHYKMPDYNFFLDEIEEVYNRYNIDGFYVDGLSQDWKHGIKLLSKEDRIVNYEIMRRIRKIVGSKGVIFYHGSGDRSEVSVIPNVDSLCDFVIYGESVPFESFKDHYIRYQVRKKSISNTIGMIKADKRSSKITIEDVRNEMLRIGNRERWWAHYQVDIHNRPVWPNIPPADILTYFNKLNRLKNNSAFE